MVSEKGSPDGHLKVQAASANGGATTLSLHTLTLQVELWTTDMLAEWLASQQRQNQNQNQQQEEQLQLLTSDQVAEVRRSGFTGVDLLRLVDDDDENGVDGEEDASSCASSSTGSTLSGSASLWDIIVDRAARRAISREVRALLKLRHRMLIGNEYDAAAAAANNCATTISASEQHQAAAMRAMHRRGHPTAATVNVDTAVNDYGGEPLPLPADYCHHDREEDDDVSMKDLLHGSNSNSQQAATSSLAVAGGAIDDGGIGEEDGPGEEDLDAVAERLAQLHTIGCGGNAEHKKESDTTSTAAVPGALPCIPPPPRAAANDGSSSSSSSSDDDDDEDTNEEEEERQRKFEQRAAKYAAPTPSCTRAADDDFDAVFAEHQEAATTSAP